VYSTLVSCGGVYRHGRVTDFPGTRPTGGYEPRPTNDGMAEDDVVTAGQLSRLASHPYSVSFAHCQLRNGEGIVHLSQRRN
jgi:hypothetical protein